MHRRIISSCIILFVFVSIFGLVSLIIIWYGLTLEVIAKWVVEDKVGELVKDIHRQHLGNTLYPVPSLILLYCLLSIQEWLPILNCPLPLAILLPFPISLNCLLSKYFYIISSEQITLGHTVYFTSSYLCLQSSMACFSGSESG